MTRQTRLGRTATGRAPWPEALTAGCVATGLIAALVGTANHGDPHAWQLVVVITPCVFLLVAAAAWLLRIDRRTLRGATANPQQSVESQWYGVASQASFHDMLVVLGLATLLLSVVPAWRAVTAHDALLAVLVFVMADFGARYLLLSRRGA